MFAQTPSESNYRTPAPPPSPATFVTHLVAGVPLLKVGVGPRTAPNLSCAAAPLYRCTSSDSIIITTAPSPKSITYHIISISIQRLWFTSNLAVCSLTIINPTLSHPHLSTSDTTSLPTHPTQPRYQFIVTHHLQTYQVPVLRHTWQAGPTYTARSH